MAQLCKSWSVYLDKEFQKPYMQKLKSFLVNEREQQTIYPKMANIFNAYNNTQFEAVKVVILGQDPYHGTGQAHGLSFSVPEGMPIPPSLVNIFKTINQDLKQNHQFKSGNLLAWAQQGVFLLNTVLTVRKNEAASHRNKGWEGFTDASIKALSDHREHLVFLLWGSFAKEKIQLINSSKHLVLTSVHPSPLSAHRGFFECQHFSKTNHYLQEHNIKAINWFIH